MAMSPREFAAATGLSLTYVYSLFRENNLPGGLKPLRVGRRWLVSRKAVEYWLEQNRPTTDFLH